MNEEVRQYIQAGKKNVIVLYVLYLCGIILPAFPVIIGAIFAYINQDTKDQELATHYKFLVNTFLMGIAGFIIYVFTMMFVVFAGLWLIGILIYPVLYIWYIARLAMGLKYIINNNPHPNPNTLWIK